MDIQSLKIVWLNSIDLELALMKKKTLSNDKKDSIYLSYYCAITPALLELLPKSKYPGVQIEEDYNECSSTDPEDDAAFYDYGEEYGVDTNPSDDVWFVSGLRMTSDELEKLSKALSKKINPKMKLSIRVKGCDRSAWRTIQNRRVYSR